MKTSTPLDFTDHTIFKKIKQSSSSSSSSVFSDENLLYEVLKHVDAKTLATAACVSKHWHRTAQDERLWEQICMGNIGCDNEHLRIVVLALGGFRCLHSRYLLPLSKPSVSTQTSTSSSNTVAAATSSPTWPCLPPPPPRAVAPAKVDARWGKDEIQLSLSLLSVCYFRKLNYK